MQRWLGRYADLIYAALRLMVGLLFACHGVQIVFGAFGGAPGPRTTFILVGGIIQLVGGSLVAVGLLTSWVAFISSGEMAVAYFKFHAPGGFWPILNQGELAVLYCFVFLYIASRGGGAYSADAKLLRGR